MVCPDVDAVIYRLAGVFNEAAGYGVKNDTFELLDMLGRIGEQPWFRIGDKDFATHLVRTKLLRSGQNLTQATLELCRRFGVQADVLPMTDDAVRTRFETEKGELSFQEFFVRERLKPKLHGIKFAGIETAQPSSRVIAALEPASLIIIGPSNPLISIAPILALVRSHIDRPRTVAVTPIVGGVALKGPTIEMMRSMGVDPSPLEVARMYQDVATTFVLDRRDRELAPAIEEMGYRTIVADTVMRDGGRSLAQAILAPEN